MTTGGRWHGLRPPLAGVLRSGTDLGRVALSRRLRILIWLKVERNEAFTTRALPAGAHMMTWRPLETPVGTLGSAAAVAPTPTRPSRFLAEWVAFMGTRPSHECPPISGRHGLHASSTGPMGTSHRLRVCSGCRVLGTHAGLAGSRRLHVHAPLLRLRMRGVVALARPLGVLLELTWSCYFPTEAGAPCGGCVSVEGRRRQPVADDRVRADMDCPFGAVLSRSSSSPRHTQTHPATRRDSPR